jgi:hypothetical protein
VCTKLGDSRKNNVCSFISSLDENEMKGKGDPGALGYHCRGRLKGNHQSWRPIFLILLVR